MIPRSHAGNTLLSGRQDKPGSNKRVKRPLYHVGITNWMFYPRANAEARAVRPDDDPRNQPVLIGMRDAMGAPVPQ